MLRRARYAAGPSTYRGRTGAAGFKKAPASGRFGHAYGAFRPTTYSGLYKPLPFRGPSAPAAFTSLGAEIKAIDIPSASYLFRVPATASNIILLNGIQTGTGFFNRVGSKVEMKNLHVRGYILNSATATISMGRILIVYDRQPTPAAGLPVISDILQTRDQTGAATTAGSSEINLDNRDRFAILRDYEVYLPPVTNTAGVLTNGPQFDYEGESMAVNIFLKLKGLTTHFKSTSNPTTITDIATGALYACFVNAGSDSTWAATLDFRLRYHDK